MVKEDWKLKKTRWHIGNEVLSTQFYTPFLSPSAHTTNNMERRDAAAGRIWKEVSTVGQEVSKTVKKDGHKGYNE